MEQLKQKSKNVLLCDKPSNHPHQSSEVLKLLLQSLEK
uniref:Uncharacterized protein n=1 Tax=Rhizophora mucronata TaxID=61149 RepID=A0A2P2MYH6_RHIMU